jgi:hypothetical protein
VRFVARCGASMKQRPRRKPRKPSDGPIRRDRAEGWPIDFVIVGALGHYYPFHEGNTLPGAGGLAGGLRSGVGRAGGHTRVRRAGRVTSKPLTSTGTSASFLTSVGDAVSSSR